MTYDEIKKYADEDNMPGLMMEWRREKEYLIEKNVAEEKELKYQEAIQMVKEEKLMREKENSENKKTILETDVKIKKMLLEADIKIKKLKKVVDLVAQGMSKEDAFKKVEDMQVQESEVLQTS